MKNIQKTIRNIQPHWVGDGFPVRGLFSYNDAEAYDPFLLLDYGGPYEFKPAAKPRGVGEHPHRGFETVTIVYQGELEHRDSGGNRGSIGSGDVQWMTAGAGVVHEEFHSERFTREGGMFEMAQLWVNLPAKDKMTAPGYQSIRNAQIPAVALPDRAGTARIIAGEFEGTHGPANTFSPINVWDLQVNAEESIELQIPKGHTSMLIVQDGSLTTNDTSMKSVELALLDRLGDSVHIQTQTPVRVLVLTGQPLNEPVVGQGPFVMNTQEQIGQAIEDYQSGRMGRF